MTRDSTTKTPTGALDYAKFVFALMIVGIHVPYFASQCFGGADGALAFYFGRGCLVRIAVPGFFAITGYLFARSIDGMKSTREQWLRLVHVEKRLTLLWLAWAPINIPVSLFQSYFMMDSPPANLWTFDHFLWGGGYTVAWFIVATMMALPIVLAVNRARCRGLSIAVFGFFYILCLAERPYSGVMPTAVTRLVEFWTSLFASPVFSFAIACPFIALGILTWRRRKTPLRHLSLLSTALAAAYVAETYVCRNWLAPPLHAKVEQNPIYISCGPLVACILCWLIRKDVPCNGTIRRLSVAVMMSHICFRTIIDGLGHWGWMPNSLLKYAAVVALSVGTGFALIRLSQQHGLRWIENAL